MPLIPAASIRLRAPEARLFSRLKARDIAASLFLAKIGTLLRYMGSRAFGARNFPCPATISYRANPTVANFFFLKSKLGVDAPSMRIIYRIYSYKAAGYRDGESNTKAPVGVARGAPQDWIFPGVGIA